MEILSLVRSDMGQLFPLGQWPRGIWFIYEKSDKEKNMEIEEQHDNRRIDDNDGDEDNGDSNNNDGCFNDKQISFFQV